MSQATSPAPSRLERIRVPHTLVLLMAMMAVALVATWLVPQGSFDTDEDNAVVAGSFEVHEERVWLAPTELLMVVPRALADAQGIIFFVFLIGGALAIIRRTGAIDAMLGRILEVLGQRGHWLIIGAMFVFAAASGTFGMAEEYIPFIAILVTLCAAMRMDAITAVGIMVCGYGIGYGVAVLNPFTLLVAQEVSGLDPASGWAFRLAIFAPFLAIGIHHVWSYARKVQANPEASLVHDIPNPHVAEDHDYPEMTWAHRLILIAMLAAVVLLIVGVTQWGWYLTELSALFFGLGIISAIIGRLGVNDSAKVFCEGAAVMTTTALLIGFARGIAMIMEDGEILHTVVHALSIPLSVVGAELSAVGMLFIQTILNLFIPSGSGQAYATMPIMAPIGDLVGVPRQVAVLAFQFGDGFANMFVPTNAILMGILGIAGIPYDRWLRFIFPLIIKLMIAGSITLAIAVMIGYS